MPIISNANHDFSNLSVSTDDSSLDLYFTEVPETETIKGVYFQRAQRLHGISAVRDVDHSEQALINVGGDRYMFPWSTLQEFPLTRLGQLRQCRSPDDIAQLCDDYDEARREFFFDRSSVAFRVILNFLAAGKLRLLRQVCAVSLSDELTYWGIDPIHMERCCRRKLMSRVEDATEKKRKEEERKQKRLSLQKPLAQEKGYVRLMRRLQEIMENPHSGNLGKIFACFSVIMIAVTVISLCISTMPDHDNKGECTEKCRNIFIVETVCVAWFSMEFFLRFLQAESKIQFLRNPLNIIDVIAILPYYISLVVDLEEDPDEALLNGTGSSHGYLDKLGLILRVTRALRILYVMRLARHSLGLQTLGLTMQRSMREFGLLLLFLCVAVALFSPLVHLAEKEFSKGKATGPHAFSSIPASYWWAIISMTTVGYGDMVPYSIPGQVVAFSSILSGILIMAFPATSIFHVFSRSYHELKREQEQVLKEERVASLDASAKEDVQRLLERDFLSVANLNSVRMSNGTTARQFHNVGI
ncbi:hypothetical protein DNTS_011727 [Danionella cerebrum]|uniref:BTB domain-containing protein n=1 Tax=Danionella cerebrum TaxID=2873325 RepID=A0A553P190_9TELE|nr:hypothetical protein DNTS_011727 [Danionella translucida]